MRLCQMDRCRHGGGSVTQDQFRNVQQATSPPCPCCDLWRIYCCSCFALRAPNPPGASGGEWCYIERRAGCAAWQVLCCVAGACGSWEVGWAKRRGDSAVRAAPLPFLCEWPWANRFLLSWRENGCCNARWPRTIRCWMAFAFAGSGRFGSPWKWAHAAKAKVQTVREYVAKLGKRSPRQWQKGCLSGVQCLPVWVTVTNCNGDVLNARNFC